MTGLERMRVALTGGTTDVCPAAPIFWGAEYVWKQTGRTLLDQMHGTPPQPLHAARCIARAHDTDWLLLTLDDGDGWLAGKECAPLGEDVSIRDPASDERFVFQASGRALCRRDGTPLHAPVDAVEPLDEAGVRAALRVAPSMPDEPLRVAWRGLADEHGTTRFLCGATASPFVDTCYRYGAQRTMMLLAESPTLFHEAASWALQAQRTWLSGLKDSGLHGVLIAESYASCDMISPAQYRDFAFPYQQAMVRLVHDLGLLAIMFSTGNLLPILETMRGLEADGLVVESSRKGVEMDIGEVRRRYGSGRCLFGNVSSEDLMVRGDLEGIAREVARQIDVAGAGGAFVASNGACPVCDATPPRAVDCLISTAHGHRYR